jgi:hypothetical protein
MPVERDQGAGLSLICQKREAFIGGDRGNPQYGVQVLEAGLWTPGAGETG